MRKELILFGIVALVIAGYFLFPTIKDVVTNIPTPTPEDSIDTSDWKTYTNEEYGFSFKYPKDLTIETPESTSSKQLVSFGKRGPNDLQDIHPNDSLWFEIYVSDLGSNFNEFVNSNVYERLIIEGDDTTGATEGEKLIQIYDDDYLTINDKEAFGFSYIDFTGTFDLDLTEIKRTRITRTSYIRLNNNQILVFSSDLRDSTMTNLESYSEVFNEIATSLQSSR